MFKIIILILIGIAIGKIFDNKNLIVKTSNRLIPFTVWILLFIFGISIGNNKDIIDNIAIFGIQAISLSLFSILGSVIFSFVLYISLFKHDG